MGRSLVRNIVGQRRSTINFRKAIEQKQIIFIKLPIKTIAQDARLIGTILLSQIHAALFSFADVPETQRPGLSLYVDEFQHFATSDFADLLTEGRKFGIRVTIAHQYRNQLPTFLRDSTMTARTKVCFQTTPEDGREMAHLYPSEEATVALEDIEVHPVTYLHSHPSNDPVLRVFVETYLHPLQGHKRGAGRIEIESWKNSGPNIYGLLSGDYDNPRVADPTYRLNMLLFETMTTGNAWLPIPPEVVEGFANCGQGFYKQAAGMSYNHPLLQPDAGFPSHLIVQGSDGELHWTRPPEDGKEQLYHFIFYLRSVMMRLAEQPIGKATTVSPTEVAKMLTSLPRRAAFVRSADTVGVVYTHDTIPALPRQMLGQRAMAILNHTRQTYCRPRAEVEKALIDANPSANGGFDASQPIKPIIRWEEVE